MTGDSAPHSTHVEVHPVSPEHWADLERVFGPRGACAGCWCMWWRLPHASFGAGKGDSNRESLRALVVSGTTPGLLAYRNGQPIGWCAFGPREDYPALARSRILKPVDDRPVWSVTCFFIARGQRRQGLTRRLLAAAVEHAQAYGAQIVEGYPIEPKNTDTPPVFAFTGTASAFRAAGFVEVARRSDTRPVMRYLIADLQARGARR
jgi:GNAT superfamily N-acetyltransferase